jgi:hypothetical protein
MISFNEGARLIGYVRTVLKKDDRLLKRKKKEDLASMHASTRRMQNACAATLSTADCRGRDASFASVYGVLRGTRL